MNFSELSSYLEKLEQTSSRIEITKILVDLFNKCSVAEIENVTNLILGQLAPRYKSVVFNIADRMVIRSIAKAYKTDSDSVTKVYKKIGDLGETAQSFAQKTVTKSNTYEVGEIFEKLQQIAALEGEGSQDFKIDNMAELLVKIDSLSTKYIVRITLGKLRLGFSDKTILDALSWMETGGKEKKAKLESAYNIIPDVGVLARHVKEIGIDKTVVTVKPILGVPLLPMLAARLKSPTEMVEKMHEVAVEPKYDGLRIQIHFMRNGFADGKKVKAFTRNMNETSWMFPELEDLAKYVDATDAIFDSEAIGVDEARKTMANFQTTMTRRRKHDIEEISKKVGIKFCIFDLLYLNSVSLIDKPYLERRIMLAETLKDSAITEVVDYKITSNAEKINELMRKNLGDGLEGIIVKRADSKYVAGRTGWRWVKMKEEESSKAKLADTIDAVVMGYYRGKGKRTNFGIGGFLVGILEGEIIKTLTKIGTGLTDEQFRELKKRLINLETKEKPKEYGEVVKILLPDVWVVPSLVVEIAADEITKSPNHSSGYALRFPRLVRFRDDKDLKQATTTTELSSIREK